MPTATVTLEELQRSKDVALTRSTVAAALGVDARTITASIENGSIPSVRLGRRVLIPRLPFLALFGAGDSAPAA